MNLDTFSQRRKFEVEIKYQGHWKRKRKIVFFHTYVSEKWVDLQQIETSVIIGSFYACR